MIIALIVAAILFIVFLVVIAGKMETETGENGKKAATTVWAVVVIIGSAIGLIFLASLDLVGNK